MTEGRNYRDMTPKYALIHPMLMHEFLCSFPFNLNLPRIPVAVTLFKMKRLCNLEHSACPRNCVKIFKPGQFLCTEKDDCTLF